MRTLYIVGNGFDMAHGLDTRYWKFREYLEDKYPDFLYQFENLYNIQAIDDSDPRIKPEDIERWKKSVDNALWSTFEDKMGKPDIEGMMEFSQSILDDMCLDGGNVGIRDTMNQYWREQYGFVTAFQEYVKEWIESVDTSSVRIKRSDLIGSTDCFITINYTDLLERVYQIEDVFHIHGSVSSVTDIDPIMGHCNKADIEQHKIWGKDADEEYAEGEASIHDAVVDYLTSIYKDTDELIQMNSHFWKGLSDINRVIIIGWSAGEVDRHYLRKIKESISPTAKWTYYWYNKKAHDDIEEALKTEGISGSFVVEDHESVEFWD